MQNQQEIPPLRQQLLNLFLSRQYEECLKFIEKVRTSKVVDAAQLTLLEVGCWTHLGIKQDEGTQKLTELLQKDPRNPFAFYGLGLNFYMNGKFQESLYPFTRAVELKPSSMQRAAVYKEKATKIIDTLNNGKWLIKPEFTLNNVLIFLSAASEFSSGRGVKALETMSVAVLIDPENKSVEKIVKKMTDDFLQILVSTLEAEVFEDSDATAKLNRIEFLIKSNKLADAGNLLPTVDPTDDRGWFVRGLLAYMKGSLKMSLVCFHKALSLNDKLTEAQEYSQKAEKLVELIEGATHQMSLKNDELAAQMLTEALEVDKENKRIVQAIYFQRSMCKLNMEKQNEAFEDYLQFEALQNQTGMIMDGIKFETR